MIHLLTNKLEKIHNPKLRNQVLKENKIKKIDQTQSERQI